MNIYFTVFFYEFDMLLLISCLATTNCDLLFAMAIHNRSREIHRPWTGQMYRYESGRI